MENRFGFKELVLSVLMISIIIVLLVAMKQYDRQWDQMQKISAILQEHTTELKKINQSLARGVKGGDNTPTSENNDDTIDPFARISAARAMPDFAEGDWSVDALGAAVGKLTPLVSSDVYASNIQGYVLESLADRDPETLEWRPFIAKSWTISEDGLTVTFKLRDNVHFSDGSPLTADDVVFTYNWIMNPQVAAPRDRSYLDKITSVQKDDDYTVIFKLSENYFKGFEICAGMSILSKKFYGQFTPEQFNELPGLLFGSGPYKLSVDPTQWKPGEGKIELVRNDKYWGVQPAYDRMVYREITDATAREVAFRNGEIDRYGPTPEQYLRLKEDKDLLRDSDLYEYEAITGGYRYVAWNQMLDGKPTLFADKRVRQALTMLTNREQMCRTLMVGLATPTTGPFHRLGNQYSKDVELWPYDPDRAIALLKEAGFSDRDGDGVIESADGTPFKFKLIYPSSSINYQQMAFFLKDAYARAGIVLEPDPLEWTIMIQRIDNRKFDAMTLGWSGTIEGDPNQIFHSKAIDDGGDNYIHYINKDLDKAIDEARVTMDEDKRMGLWHKVHEYLHEDQPYTFLWTTRAVVFVNKRIHNVQQLKLGLNSTNEWFVPLAQQKWGK